MTIARLRELLQDDPNNPRVIVTVRAKGYMIANERGEFPGAGEAS